MNLSHREKIYNWIKPPVSVMVGLGLGLLFVALAGESPIQVLSILFKSAFGSMEDFGMTLFYSTPLIFTGLSVAFAFHAGLFNIGAEGQLTAGALAAAVVGIVFPTLPSPIAPIVAILAAFAAGAFWGWIPGWLRAVRGSHEVINTIMLNFVAAGLSSWVTLYIFKTTETQNPETQTIAPAFTIPKLSYFGETPLSIAFIIALACAALVGIVLWKTVFGFEIRAVGENETASEAAGINSKTTRILAMTIAGGLAGLVGVGEVLGSAERFKMGFSPGYGFIGIAVALLGRSRPLGIIASAILFGALHKGSADLDLETEKVTRDLSQVLQAFVMFAVIADALWDKVRKKIVGVKA